MHLGFLSFTIKCSSRLIEKYKEGKFEYLSGSHSNLKFCTRGLIIIAANLGETDIIRKKFARRRQSIDGTYQNEHLREFLLKDIEASSQEWGSMNEEDEILDIRLMLQNYVKQSRLHLRYNDIFKLKGVFNPCIDSSEKPALYIR